MWSGQVWSGAVRCGEVGFGAVWHGEVLIGFSVNQNNFGIDAEKEGTHV